MALKDILVHIDDRPSCAQRIAAARDLALAHEAQLTGLYATEFPFFSLHHTNAEADREKARELFRSRTEARGLQTDWVEIDCTKAGIGMSEAVNFHAYYRDLLVIGQTDGSGEHAVPKDLPERTVLGAGRPVLILPYASDLDTVGRRVLLAWRGGPESSRAVHDAMPFLQQARSVTVISVRTPGGDGEFGPASGDLVGHLARHGVSATFEEVDPAGLAVGDMLLNRATDLGSDLLVMGAFAQSRRAIPGLGEVGRHLLKYMTIPVLMSH